jgi:hypothetical protein
MNEVKKVWFRRGRIFIETAEGRVLSQPLRFFPRLARATSAQRAAWTQSYFGLHWEALDEDISFDSFAWGDNDPETLCCTV